MTAARKLFPEVEAMRADLLTSSPTYRVIDVLRSGGGSMALADIAKDADVSRKKAYDALRHWRQTGRVYRVSRGHYAAAASPPRRPAGPRAGVATVCSRSLPTHDRHGRPVLMVLGRSPRREDCAHYEACVDITAHVTSGDARCPAECPAYVLRDSRITERDMVSGHDRSEEYSV